MSAAQSAARLPRDPDAGRSIAWWGIVTLTLTEAMLFALLLFTWYYLWSQAESWPLGDIKDPELLRSGIRSLLLFASSATLTWGERGLKAGRLGRFQLGVVVTFLLAAVFFAGHVTETQRLLGEYTWQTNAYGSLWYVITNFHALHLAVGMAMLVFTFLAARRGVYDAERHEGVTVTSIYWHFVDVVWVFVYSSLYLAVVFT